MHFVEIMNQLGLSFKTDLHLLEVVQEFVLEHEADSKWDFRIRPDGKKCWINSGNQTVSEVYPLLKKLKSRVEKYQRELGILKTDNQKKKINLLDFLLRDKIDGPAKFKKIKTRVLRVNSRVVS